MQTSFLVCNLPKRLGGSSIPELRDMCRSRKIRRQKNNNFLKTKRDMCLALTLDGSAAFQEKMSRSHLLKHEFGIPKKAESPDAIKKDITTQLNNSLERNARGLQMVKQLASEAGSQTKKVIDDHHDLLKENATFDDSTEDFETVNLRNRYHSQLEFLEQKAASLREKEKEIDDLYTTLKQNNAGLVAQRKNIMSRPLNDVDILKADIQQMRMNEREILLSLAEIKDHMYRVRTEAQRDPVQTNMSVALTDDLKRLQDMKTELESANKALKTELSRKESTSSELCKTEIEKYARLAKSKEDELVKTSIELETFKKEIAGCHSDINKLKSDLKNAKLDLSKYTDLFPSIEDATAVFNQRKELENRAQKTKNDLRNNETLLSKLIDKLDRLDDDTATLDRDFVAEPNNLSSVIRKVDKVLDRYSEMKREMASLQRQIKASDGKVRDFQSDYLQLLKITDERLDTASAVFTDRKEIFDKIKNFMTNNQYLSKALGDLRSDKDKIKTKIDRVSERMQQIGSLLDDAEKEEPGQQTGGAEHGLDVDTVMSTLDSFEKRIRGLIEKRSGLMKQITDLKSTVKNLNEELTKTSDKSMQDLQKHAADLAQQLDAQRREFLKVHDSLKKALSDLEASDESNDKKYLQLKATVEKLLGLQSSVLQNLADVQVKLSHTDALQTATKLDAAEAVVPEHPILSTPSLPEHESRLAQAKQALRDSVVSRQEHVDEINKHDETLESLEDAKLQNSDDKTELKKLEGQIRDIERQKAKAEESFRNLEKDIGEKVGVIDKLQNQLLAVQQQDTEKLEEIKSALEEAYMTQIHAKDDSLQRLSTQLRAQETADRDALRAQEQALRNESSTRLKDYMQQIEEYKQKAASEEDRDTAVLLKEKAENLEHEKEIHQQFDKALAAKDSEINQLQTSLQQRLKDVSDRHDSQSASVKRREDDSDDSDIKNQSEYLRNVKEIEESWRGRYDKIREDYEKIMQSYKEDLAAANERALKLESDLREKSQDIETAEATAKTMTERIDRLNSQHEEVSNIARGMHDELIQAQKELNKELLHKEDQRTLQDIIEHNRELSKEKIRYEEEQKKLGDENGVLREVIGNLRTANTELNKKAILQDDAEDREKTAKAKGIAMQKMYEDEKSKAIKYAESTNALKSRLDEIREAVKEFAGLKMLNTKDVHNISSPESLGQAVQAVKDIVQDYRYFRADYDKVVGKMRDNIVSIVNSLTEGSDTIDLAAIDKKAAAIMSTEDAKAELQRYKTMLYDELKREADLKYKQAQLTAKAYGVEDKFNKETEVDLNKIFESSRTPEYYKKRIDILNRFIAYITQTRQRIKARASSVFKGDDDYKQKTVDKLKDILNNDLPGIMQALKDADKLANKPAAREPNSKFRILLKYLIQTVNKINDDFKPEEVFDSSALQTKAVLGWEQSRRRYIEDVNNAVIKLARSARLTQKDVSQAALDAVTSQAPDSVYRIVPQDRMYGGVSEPNNMTFLIERVEKASGEYERWTQFFLAQWEEINDRTPDLSSYGKSLMFDVDGEDGVHDASTESKSPQGSPQVHDKTPTENQILLMRQFSRYFIQYYETLEWWPASWSTTDGGNTNTEDIRFYTLTNKPAKDLENADHMKVFEHIFAFVINAHMQRYLYGDIPPNKEDIKKRFARRYYEPIKKIIGPSIKDSNKLHKQTAHEIDRILSSVEDNLEDDNKYNVILDKFIQFRNKVKPQQTGGRIQQPIKELQAVISSLATLKEQKEQSRKYMKDLLRSIERDLVTMMKMRPHRHTSHDKTDKTEIIVGGAADDVINVRTIQPYDVDKLNEVLEGLNKMIQTQVKEMRSLKTSSREGKEWKDNFEKLDRKLVEKDVYIEQMQEIMEQSVERALTLEEELIKRDGAFDRLKLVVLGLRVRPDGGIFFDRSRNAFKTVKDSDGKVKYPEFIWDLSVTDKGNEVKRTDSINQLKSWFDSVKSRISVQMIFDVFDDAMTYQHYIGDQTSFSTENTILDTVLGLQAEIEQTVRQLNGSRYDNVYATIDDLRMLNDRWYTDIISTQARQGLIDLQSQARATLFGTKPDKFSRKDLRRKVGRLSQIAKDNIQKIQVAFLNTPSTYWDQIKLIPSYQVQNAVEALRGEMSDDSKRKLIERWQHDTKLDILRINDADDANDAGWWDTAKKTFERVTSEMVGQHLSDVTGTSLDYGGEGFFSKARKASLRTQQFIADRETIYDNDVADLDLPANNDDVADAAGDINATILQVGFFDQKEGGSKQYPDNRLDAWYVSTKSKTEINNGGIASVTSEIEKARKEVFWKISSQIGMIIDVLEFIQPGINDSYREACAALRSIACVFMIRDLYEMSAMMLASSEINDITKTLEGNERVKHFQGFIAIVKAMYSYLQSALNSASEQGNGKRLAALLDLINQVRSLQAEGEIIETTLNATVIGSGHRNALVLQQVRRLHQHLDTEVKNSFDNYLSTFVAKRTVSGGAIDDEPEEVKTSESEGFIRSAVGTLLDEVEGLVPQSIIRSLTGSKPNPEMSPFKDSDESTMSSDEMRKALDGLDASGIEKKLTQVKDLRAQVLAKKKEDLPDFAMKTLDSVEAELNMTEIYLNDKKSRQAEEHKVLDAQTAQIDDLREKIRTSNEEKQQLRRQVAMEAMKSSKPIQGRVLFAYFKPGALQTLRDGWPEQNVTNRPSKENRHVRFADESPMLEQEQQGQQNGPPLQEAFPIESSVSNFDQSDAAAEQEQEQELPSTSELIPLTNFQDPTFANEGPSQNLDSIKATNDTAELPSVLLGDNASAKTRNDTVLIGDLSSAPVATTAALLETIREKLNTGDYEGIQTDFDQLDALDLTEDEKVTLLGLKNTFNKARTTDNEISSANAAGGIIRQADEFKQRLDAIEAQLLSKALDGAWLSDQKDIVTQMLMALSDLRTNANQISDYAGNTAAGAVDAVRDLSKVLLQRLEETSKEAKRYLDAKTEYTQLFDALRQKMTTSGASELELASLSADLKIKYDALSRGFDSRLLGSHLSDDLVELDPSAFDVALNERLSAKKILDDTRARGWESLANLDLIRQKAIEVDLPSTPFDNLINRLNSALAGTDPIIISDTLGEIETKFPELQSVVESARQNKQTQTSIVTAVSERSKQLNDVSVDIARLNRHGDELVSKLRTVGKRTDAAKQLSGLITDLKKRVSQIMGNVKSLRSLSELNRIDSDITQFKEENMKHGEEQLIRLEQLVAEEEVDRKDVIDRWNALSNKDYSAKSPRKAMMDSLREVKSRMSSHSKQQGGDSSNDWIDRIDGMRLSALDLYTYLTEFFRRPSILRLISSRNFSMELSAARAAPADIKSLLHLLFVDVSTLPAQDTSRDLSTSERFWNLVTRDTATYRLQATAAGLDHDKDQAYVRADEYFKFVFWLLTARKKAIAGDPEEHQDLLVHIDTSIDTYTSWIDEDAMHALESRLKLPKIDARHVETGVSQVLTYIKVRCDNPQYWNEHFRLSYNADTRHEMYVEYNNHRFPYYVHKETDNTYKEVDPDARKAFGQYAGTGTRALKPSAPYQYDYLMGPFTRVFTPDKTAKDMASECVAIKNSLIIGQSVFILGYGASGAGKTSTLICRSGSKDCGAADSGVLLNLLQDRGLAEQFPRVELTVHELFANHDNPRIGSGLQDTKKIDDMKFVFTNGTYRYDVSSSYEHQTNIHSGSVTQGRLPGVRRYGMPPAGDDYYKDRYVNVVNTSLFDERHDLQIDADTTLSRVIKQALDDDRLTRATTNNPNSSRSHVLIMIRMIDDLPGDGQDRPYLIVGDFAGVENEFACGDLDTLLKIYNRKDPNDRRLYTQTIIDEDVASADEPSKFLTKGGAADFQTYADTPDFDLEQEKNGVQEKLRDLGGVTCKGLDAKTHTILEAYRKATPFAVEKNTILGLLPRENDMYVKRLLPSSIAKIDDIMKRTISLVSALAGEDYVERFYIALSDAYPESKIGNSDQKAENRLNQKANELYQNGIFSEKPIASLFGFDATGFGESILFSNTKPDAKSAPHQIKKMRTRLMPFFNAFGKQNQINACVETFLTAVYENHLQNLEARAFTIADAVAVCKSRTFEGIYINDSLAVVREVLKNLILHQAKDNSRLKITPPFPDLCLPIYCNPLVESCFGSDTNADDSADNFNLKQASSSLMGIIFDAVGEKAKDLKIVVFCVFLMNRTNNDPPPTAFIDGEDLRLEISRLDNRASLLATLATNVPEEAVALKEIADFFNADADTPMKQDVVDDLHASVESQRSLLGDGLCDDVLTRLRQGEWAAVMKMIDRANATHPMGTLFFTDSMAKYSLTEFSCRITSDSKIPFTKEMTRSVRYNMSSGFDELSAMVNVMDDKVRLKDTYVEPRDPASFHPTPNQIADSDPVPVTDTHVQPKDPVSVHSRAAKLAAIESRPAPSAVRATSNIGQSSFDKTSSPYYKANTTKHIVGRVPSTTMNKAKIAGGGGAPFNPATFDQMIEQWPAADGRAFSEFLVDAHKQKHLLVKRRRSKSPRKPRRMTRK